MTSKILRLPKTLDRIGIGRSTLYQRIADGLWTRPVPIGLRAVGWPESEVSALTAALIAGKSQADIRELVTKLQAERGGVQ